MWVLFLATIKKNQQCISEHYTFCVYNANCKKFTNISTDLPFAEQILSNKDCASLQPPDFSSEDVI